MQLGLEYLFGAFSNGETNLDLVDVEQQGEHLAKRMKTLTEANPTLTKSAIAATVIAGTAIAAYAAYSAMSKRLSSVEDERQSYQDMIDQGVSTYVIVDDRTHRRHWDHYVSAYLKSLQDMQSHDVGRLLWRSAGIHQKTIQTEKLKGIGYGVMSAFATPLGIYFPETEDDRDILTQARKSLNVLLQGDLKQLLSEINAELRNDWLMDMQLFVEAQSYLTWLNASRFLLISLGDIAASLLFAMNPNTNMPLSYADTAELCGLLRTIIGRMRSDTEVPFSKNRSSLCQYKSLDQFLASLDGRIAILKTAYENRAEIGLNVNEVINSEHLVLQQLATNLRKLVYMGLPFIEPDHLNSKMLDLANLIYFHPELVPDMVKQLKLKDKFDYAALGVNSPPRTVMDVLILWSDAAHKIRRSSLKTMPSKTDWHQRFISILTDINTFYIKPIEALSTTKYLGGLMRYPKDKNIQLSPGRIFFIASVAMLLEVYRLNLIEQPSDSGKTANQQIREINAKASKDNAVHGLRVLDLLALEPSTRDVLKQVYQKRLYKVFPILTVVTLLERFRQKQEHTGNTDEFQHELTIRLHILKDKQKKLTKAINALIISAENEQKSNKDLLSFLSGLKNKDPKTALSIPSMIKEFERAIQHTLDMLDESKYDDILEADQQQLINRLEEIDRTTFFPTAKDKQQFYRALRASTQSKSLFTTAAAVNEVTFETDKSKEIPEDARSVDSNETSYANEPWFSVQHPQANLSTQQALSATSKTDDALNLLKQKADPQAIDTTQVKTNLIKPIPTADQNIAIADQNTLYAFRLHVFSVWLSRVSAVLLLLGFFVVLLMAFGAQTIPAIQVLGTSAITGFVIAGFVSAATGGFGLAASYYTPKLFKPITEVAVGAPAARAALIEAPTL